MNKEQFTIDLEQLCIRHKVAIVWSPEFCTIQIHDDDLGVPLGTGCKLEFVQAAKMTEFKVGDRVKVVRESVDRPEYNCSLLPDIGNSGKIFERSTVPNVWFVEIDNGDGYFFPADMLELEADNG